MASPGPRTVFIMHLFAAAAAVAVVFPAHIAAAQPINTPESPAHDMPSYCKQSKLNGIALMQSVRKIITHGDLTDFAFAEKTLETKFGSKTYAQTISGARDTGGVRYWADHALGSPIRVSLLINYSKERQAKSKLIAGISIESEALPNSDTSFIIDCLKISQSDFSNYFGGGFLVNLPTCCGDPLAEATKEPASVGKNGSRIYLGIEYVIKSNFVTEIQIAQDP